MIWGVDFRGRAASALCARGGPSAGCWRTVREAPVRRVFVVFLRVFAFDPIWLFVLVAASLRTVRARVADSPGVARTVRPALADGPFFPGSFLVFCVCLTDGPRRGPDGPRRRRGRSAVAGRTVRVVHRGRSALPGRTVRQELCAVLLVSFPSFPFQCFRVCFKESFLGLEVDP
jgi:hypothetical protein